MTAPGYKEDPFDLFLMAYEARPSIAYADKQLYKVRVIDGDPYSENKHFLDKTGTVYVYAKSRTKAQIEVRKLARSMNVKIETGFAREVV